MDGNIALRDKILKIRENSLKPNFNKKEREKYTSFLKRQALKGKKNEGNYPLDDEYSIDFNPSISEQEQPIENLPITPSENIPIENAAPSPATPAPAPAPVATPPAPTSAPETEEKLPETSPDEIEDNRIDTEEIYQNLMTKLNSIENNIALLNTQIDNFNSQETTEKENYPLNPNKNEETINQIPTYKFNNLDTRDIGKTLIDF